jgi:hypothetical protein
MTISFGRASSPRRRMPSIQIAELLWSHSLVEARQSSRMLMLISPP